MEQVNYPKFSLALQNLGEVEERTGRFMAAKTNYEIALRLREEETPSNSTTIKTHLKRINEAIRNTSKQYKIRLIPKFWLYHLMNYQNRIGPILQKANGFPCTNRNYLPSQYYKGLP